MGQYTLTYFTREEFEKVFNHDLYLQVREKYGCNGAFPLLYDKVSYTARTGKKLPLFDNDLHEKQKMIR